MNYLFVFIFLLIFTITDAHKVFCQYVAQTLQERIDDDNKAINRDLDDIAIRNADIQNIVADQQAVQVTSQVPDVQYIQAAQIETVEPMAISSVSLINGT